MHSTLFIILGEIIYALFILFVIIKIIKDTDNPAKSLGYILVVIFLPIIGIALYFSVGINYRKRKLYKRKFIENKELFDRVERNIKDYSTQQLVSSTELIGNFDYTVKMLLNDSLSPLTNVEECRLLINGEQKFDDVLRTLEGAKNHIHIQYYIYADDIIGNKIKDILIRKASEGIEVRFMFDDFGSHGVHKRIIAQLQAGGVQTAAFYKIHLYALANRMNYRNHRKVIVVDGHIGFVGGINVDDRYINNGTHELFWRDTHLMLKGAAVWSLQYTFMSDWNFCSNHKIDAHPHYFKFSEQKTKGSALVQIATSGPDSARATIMLSYMGIIMACKKRLYITTPYFIPNEAIIDALKHAALSGVDVRLLVPGESDGWLVNAASCSNYAGLLDTGVRIYRYSKGFVHAKTMVADNNLVVVGSANMDMRSFDLNFEINALVFNAEINQQLHDAFINDISHSDELSTAEWEQRSRWQKLSEWVARLMSPLL